MSTIFEYLIFCSQIMHGEIQVLIATLSNCKSWTKKTNQIETSSVLTSTNKACKISETRLLGFLSEGKLGRHSTGCDLKTINWGGKARCPVNGPRKCFNSLGWAQPKRGPRPGPRSGNRSVQCVRFAGTGKCWSSCLIHVRGHGPWLPIAIASVHLQMAEQ